MNRVIYLLGETNSSYGRLAIRRGETTLLFRDVPVDVCSTCREEYVTETTATWIPGDARSTHSMAGDVVICRYGAEVSPQE